MDSKREELEWVIESAKEGKLGMRKEQRLATKDECKETIASCEKELKSLSPELFSVKLHEVTHGRVNGLLSYDEIQGIKKALIIMKEMYLEEQPYEQMEDRIKNIVSALDALGFTEYLKEKQYSVRHIILSINENAGKSLLPFCIALLHEISFIKYIDERMFNNQTDRDKKLAAIFKSNQRRVRGNINVLKPSSEEDRAEYTSHKYSDKVKRIIKDG